MWSFGLNRQRKRLLKKGIAAPLADYLSDPLPKRSAPIENVEFLALDLETTGLDPAQDEILSLGMVPIVNEAIRLAGARHYLISASKEIPEASAVIHGIREQDKAAGKPLEEVLPEVLAALKGRVLLAHHAAVELEFLSAACRSLYGGPLLVRTVDTLQLALASEKEPLLPEKPLQLASLRRRYGLPPYPLHHALSDALATAELFLALKAARFGESSASLWRILS